tara:strand:+ start:454 stop:684 length:231 start_codon:yes stop_codon:yes gene_type:complete
MLNENDRRLQETIAEEIFGHLSDTQIVEYTRMTLDDIVNSLRYMMKHSDLYDNDKEWWEQVARQVQQVSNVYVTGI